ncbi:hypothetical protein SAMN05421827_10262 [Pedobacter terrae]|uniref:Uncharacterized protein n=1 Tax=Pedobacter terrae TaxID=405671 RepID=A0A1G7PYH7_9SPHI|nr:hypothetical protein [Pedobacter terrae]SDF90420.1 hypothetical protein SAMN05421827_10262 [Pedobacter terrae]
MNKPNYLKNFTVDVDQLEGYPLSNWFEKLTWKGQLTSGVEEFFRIIYCGEKCEDGFLKNKEDYPLVVFAENIKTNDKILLFDERIHGYEALLIEEKDFQENYFEQHYSYGSEEVFEVFIWTNTSVDFEDEFGLDGAGEIELLNGKKVDVEYLRLNAFDAFGIIIRNKDQEYIKLVEIELM